MKRSYHKWFSPSLQKEMELLVFGHSGARVLFFPPRKSHFYDYENWGLIEMLKTKIEKGYIQLFCLDSIDDEALYNREKHPAEKIKRHIDYENYVINEVIPFTKNINTSKYLIAAGCSLGAYHAVNIGLKHPSKFHKIVGMSGRYDLTIETGHYHDLLNGYHDTDVYFNMPNQYMANLTDTSIINQIKKLDIILAVGSEDPCVTSNQTLRDIFLSKDIHNLHLHIWDDEAHKVCHWKDMIKIYF